MKILLVNPQCADTFWSFKYALRFISRKVANPPLGLLTVSALLPGDWEKRVVDMNDISLREEDVGWADLVFIGAMDIQRHSVKHVIRMCQKQNKKMVAGGPLFTSEPEEWDMIDFLVLNEAEITLPWFLNDWEQGTPKHLYQTDEFPSLALSPVPDYYLLNLKKYATLSLQYSRGCPFDCEFCDITALFGRKVRTKSAEQVLTELESLYSLGYRGNIFFVDDNFIGNKAKLKRELLPKLIAWTKERNYPFRFNTEASINLADDEELMSLMVQAGFESVFVGIETPEQESLAGCNKIQNTARNMVEDIRKMQRFGLQVSGGFIVGFDQDSPSVFQRQIEFIQQSGIVTAMVGLLNAQKKTKLYQRLKDEERLLDVSSGNNTDFSMNFIPRMNLDFLLDGYRQVLKEIYSYEPYYQRVRHFLTNYRTGLHTRRKMTFANVKALIRSMFVLGVLKQGQFYYWRLFVWTIFHCPENFPEAITLAIYGYHFRKIYSIA